MNLVEGLHEQIARARELRKLCDALPGGVGAPGADMIRLRIQLAEASIRSGNIEDMMIAYKALEALE